MSTDTNLTREQIFSLSFLGIIGNIVYIHTWIDDATKNTAWVSALIGILILIPFAIWIFFLGNAYPSETLFHILKDGVGKVANLLLGIVYIIINIIISVTHLNMFSEMIDTFFLPITPLWIIMVCVTCTATLIISGRVHSFVRLVEFLAVLGVLNYFITFVFAFPSDFHIDYITPVFNTSIWSFIKGSLFIASSASECLLLLMIFVSFVPEPSKHYLWIVKGILFSAVIFSIAIMIIMAMMSPELAKRIAFGGVNAARLINIGEFIQGLEVLVFVTYQFIAIGKIAICIYCAASASKIIFGGKKQLIHTLTISALVLAGAIFMGSYTLAYFTAVFMTRYAILPFSIVVILLTAVSIKIKAKRTERVIK